MATHAHSTPQRLVALDVFRGLTIALMFIVNNPGTWSYVYPPLLHAKWHGWTPTDWVFPFFLFTVGVAAWFSLKKYQIGHAPKDLYFKIVKRGFMIFLIGLGLNMYLNSLSSFENLRIMGVLQRIGIAYMLGSLLCVSFSQRNVAIIGGLLLVGYWLLMKYMSDPSHPFGLHDGLKYLGIDKNIVTKFDNSILGKSHLYKGYDGIPFDPEGLLSTIPAIVTVIIGFFTGKLIDSYPNRLELVKKMLLYGIGALALGWLMNFDFPINKPIWSSSYVVFMAGWCLVINSLLIWLIDVKPDFSKILGATAFFSFMAIGYGLFKTQLIDTLGETSYISWLTSFIILGSITLLFGIFNSSGFNDWKTPILVMGMNSLLAFVVSGVFAKTFAKVKMDSSYETVTEQWNNNAIVPKRISSLQKLYEDVFSPIITDRQLLKDVKNKVLTKENNPSVFADFTEQQKLSSFLYALFQGLIFWIILWVFYRNNIFLKV